MSDFKSFETDRLLLKPTTIDDATFQLKLMNSELWLENIGDRGVYTKRDAERYIEVNIISQFKRLGYANYTVFRKIDNEKMGVIGLYDRPSMEGIDIGFAFLPAFFGQGYAYEGAARLMDAAINEFKLDKIKAITIPSNVASHRLLEKLGLSYIKNIHLPDDPVELMYYEWNRTDLNNQVES